MREATCYPVRLEFFLVTWSVLLLNKQAILTWRFSYKLELMILFVLRKMQTVVNAHFAERFR